MRWATTTPGNTFAGSPTTRVSTCPRVATLAGQPTGRAVITVGDDTGENTIVVVPGANSAVHVDVVPNGRVVLAQLEVPLDAVVTAFVAAKQRGAITILNPAPATELPTELLAVTDVVVPNEHEIGLIGGVEALLDLGVSTVIVTRGASGVEVSTAGHRSPTAYARSPSNRSTPPARAMRSAAPWRPGSRWAPASTMRSAGRSWPADWPPLSTGRSRRSPTPPPSRRGCPIDHRVQARQVSVSPCPWSITEPGMTRRRRGVRRRIPNSGDSELVQPGMIDGS